MKHLHAARKFVIKEGEENAKNLITRRVHSGKLFVILETMNAHNNENNLKMMLESVCGYLVKHTRLPVCKSYVKHDGKNWREKRTKPKRAWLHCQYNKRKNFMQIGSPSEVWFSSFFSSFSLHRLFYFILTIHPDMLSWSVFDCLHLLFGITVQWQHCSVTTDDSQTEDRAA